MTEEPEQVLEQDRVAAAGGVEELGTEMAVGQQHGYRPGQHRQRGDQQESGDQPAPGEERQLHHGHAGRPHVEDGDNDVDRPHDRRDAEDMYGEDGEIDAHPALYREWRVEGPPGCQCAVADTEQGQRERQGKQERGGRQQPETPVIEARQRHVGRADHQRDHPVGKSGGGRHQCREDHHQRMDADQLVEKLGLHQLQSGLEQLGAYREDHDAADEEHDQRKGQVHRPDVLVVRRRQPADETTRVLLMSVVMFCGQGGCGAHLGSPSAVT